MIKWIKINSLVVLAFLAAVGMGPDSPARATHPGLEGTDTVVDEGGRRLRVRQPFKRIISLYGAHTENLFALGLDEEIIGVSPHEVFPPQAAAKPSFSYHDDPERFLAARPDLVLIRPMIDRGYAQLITRLEKSSIAVVSLQPGTIDEMYNYWKALGILTGKQARAAEMVVCFKKAVARLASLTRNQTPRKRVYFEAIHSKMKTFTPNSVPIFALETAGGINIAGDATPVRSTNIAAYGKERILSHAAHIDVYLAQTGVMNRPTRSLIRDEPGFKAIRAIQKNQIFIIDEMIVSRPTLRLLNGIFEIGRCLYPDVFNAKAADILRTAHGTTRN